MTSDVGRRPAPTVPSIPTASLRSRIYGFGSVFGKTLRDSRRAVIVVSVLLALLLIGVSNAIVSEFATPESRRQLADIVRRMQRKGLLQRRRTKEDARAYAVKLTDEGRKALRTAEPLARKVDDRILDALPDRQRDQFVNGLMAIVDTLQKLAPQA